MSHIKLCPRCGERSFEVMSTYAHCPNCLNVEDYWDDSEKSYHRAMKAAEDYVAQEQNALNEEEADEEDLESVA